MFRQIQISQPSGALQKKPKKEWAVRGPGTSADDGEYLLFIS